MTPLTISETARWLLDQDQLLLLTHIRPDGDTLGSAAALCLGLRQLGKQVQILKNPGVTQKYLHLVEGLTAEAVPEGATVVSVDVATVSLLTDAALGEKVQLRIDHHGTGESFAPLELLAPTAASSGDIIYDLLLEMGVTLDAPMAEALYTAVSTDTGCFRYANTNAHAYRVAAACYEAGGQLHRINQEIFDTNSLARLRLQGWIVENLRLSAGGQVAVCALPLEVEKKLQLTEDDLENVSGFPRSVEGVRMAATLRQTEDGKVKISVRAVPGYDAAAVCAHFGGGGHKGAAGATVTLTLEEAALAVAQKMEEWF